MKPARRPLEIALGALAVFALGFAAVGAAGWGPPAANESAIGEISRWCERVSGGLLREPINTLGNLGFVVAGLAMFWTLARDESEGRPSESPFVGNRPIGLLYASATVFLGPGSMVMHGTHTAFGAWLDNVSMVAYVLVPWLYNLSVLGGWGRRTFATAYASLLLGYAMGYPLLGPDLGIDLRLFELSIPLWLISESLVAARWPAFRWLSGFVGFGVAAAFGLTPAEMLADPARHWWVVLFWLPALITRDVSPVRRRYVPWFWIGVASFLAAYAIWTTGTADSPSCDPDALVQAHAVWHLLSAVSAWSFFSFFRTERPLPGSTGRPDRQVVSSAS